MVTGTLLCATTGGAELVWRVVWAGGEPATAADAPVPAITAAGGFVTSLPGTDNRASSAPVSMPFCCRMAASRSTRSPSAADTTWDSSAAEIVPLSARIRARRLAGSEAAEAATASKHVMSVQIENFILPLFQRGNVNEASARLQSGEPSREIYNSPASLSQSVTGI